MFYNDSYSLFLNARHAEKYKKEIKSLEILPIRNNQCYHFVIIFAATL